MADDLPIEREAELAPAQALLAQIRPAWADRSLIERVTRLMPVDPSSACQRLLNAAIHDLREKIVIAGLDIAKQAAEIHKLPPVSKPEDIENYSNDKIMDLADRMGLLTRAEWRKLKRCYDIRRDLEHEDDEYEAGLEDCVYIFKTCIEAVLSRDPVQLLRVTDVKDAIEQDRPQFPEQQFLDDYANAPEPRQREIMLFLVSSALDTEKPDVVRVNALEMIKHLAGATRTPVRIAAAADLQGRVGRAVPTLAVMKVAHAAGAMAYLKQATRNDFFSGLLGRLREVGHGWSNYERHPPPLEELEDVGGLTQCQSDEVATEILKWLVLCYVGTPGGLTRYGHVREVFYSDRAAPIIRRIIEGSGSRELGILKKLRDDRDVKKVTVRSE